jgi:DNA-binding NarL/FixJ family response regulator
LLVTLYSARESGDRELWEKTLHLADAAENPGPPLTFRWGSLAVRALAVSALRVRIRARALVLECASLSGYFLPFFPGLLGLPADLYRAELHSSLGEDEEAVAWYAAAVTLCRERARLPALAWSLLHAAAFAAKLASAGSLVSVAAIAEAADPSAQQPGSTPRRVVASGAASQRDEPGSQATLTLAHSLVNAADAVAAEVGMGFLAKVARAFRETLASNAWGEQISSRELEVLRLVSSGFTNADIANMLHISANTVAKHVRSILAKTGAANRAEAAVLASERGLL